jgi:hypothetical protein
MERLGCGVRRFRVICHIYHACFTVQYRGQPTRVEGRQNTATSIRYSTFDVGSLSGGAGKGSHDAVYGRSEHEACYDAADLSHRLNSHY